MENHTWDLIPLPKGWKLVRCKCVYRTKYVANGYVDKYKARLVAKGFSQVEGIDYSVLFPVLPRWILSILCCLLLPHNIGRFHQRDVKSAFLHGDLLKEIYMEKPPGFVQDCSLVCDLHHSLYGLKQDPQAWYEKMDNFLLSLGFYQCHLDPTVYIWREGIDLLILVLYVDELILTRSSSSMIQSVQQQLMEQFDMIDVSLLHYFLGLQVDQSTDGIFIYQQKYALDLL